MNCIVLGDTLWFESFFIMQHEIEERKLDVGFSYFGAGHLLWTALAVICVFLTMKLYRSKDEIGRMRMKRIMAAVLLASEIFRNILVVFLGENIMDYLPCHLCSFAIIGFFIDAYAPKSWLLGQITIFAFLPGAVVGFLFGNWNMYPLFCYMTVTCFVFHGWRIAYALMQYGSKELVPTYRGMWYSAIFIVVTSMPVYLFNKAADLNYMFLNKPWPGSPLEPLWNLAGTRFGEVGYMVGFGVLMVAALHLMYALLKLVGGLVALCEKSSLGEEGENAEA